MDQCHNLNKAARGRVMLAMIAQRFRLDRARGTAINVLQLYDIKLKSHKKSDVIAFMARVRSVLVLLKASEVAPHADSLYQWLFEKFKNYQPIAIEMRALRASKADSKKRSWKFIWTAIHRYLEQSYEDQNIEVYNATITGNKVVPEMTAKGDKGSKGGKGGGAQASSSQGKQRKQ